MERFEREIPRSEHIKLLFPCSRTAFMAVMRAESAEDFYRYGEDLTKEGYFCTDTNAFGENLFATYTSSEQWIFLSYHTYAKELRVIFDRPRRAILPLGEGKASLCLVQYATENSYADDVTGVACGMAYLFRLADNRLILIDGGNTNDCDGLCAMMRELTGEERPRIALWVITHPHDDHYGALKEIVKTDAVCIEAYYSCMPPSDFKPLGCADMLEGITDYDSKNISAHTGDRFVFGSLCMETLTTCEDVILEDYEKVYKDTNNLSLILRFTVEGQSILFAADARSTVYQVTEKIAGDVLKSDICQISHHGRTGSVDGEDKFISTVAPTVALWPGNHVQIAYVENKSGANRWIRSAESTVKKHFVANDGTVILNLPYRM